jgi:hypothetical protein
MLSWKISSVNHVTGRGGIFRPELCIGEARAMQAAITSRSHPVAKSGLSLFANHPLTAVDNMGLTLKGARLPDALRPFLTKMRGISSARMAELVDAPASGAGAGNGVEVRVLFRAPFVIPHMSLNILKCPENQGFSAFVMSTAIRSNLLQLTVHDGTFDGIKMNRRQPYAHRSSRAKSDAA